MNDKELADAVVALGVGVSGNNDWYLPPDHEFGATSVSAQVFLRDWRVAGALMEKCAESQDPDRRTIALSFGMDMFCATAAGSSTPTYGVYLERSDQSAPRAIIQACVEVLS